MTTEKVTLKDVYDAINELRSEMATSYVTKAEFWPVKSIVYGGAGLILIGVFGFLVSLAVAK